MAKIGVKLHPFRGLRFHPDKVKAGECIAPPYDVFEYGDTLDQVLRSIPYNIIHIQKPLGDQDEKYRNANHIFQDWCNQKILVKDEKPVFYVYEQLTKFGVRRGVIAAADLDDTYTKIKRHEKIKQGPKIDRLKLTMATGLNIGLIFTIMADPEMLVARKLEKICQEQQPLLNFLWPEGYGAEAKKRLAGFGTVENRLFIVSDPELEELLSDRVLYIADGHHRYQTMIDYRNRLRAINGDNPDADYERTLLFAAPDTDMVILGYHRIVKNLPNETFARFLDKLTDKFFVTKSNAAEIPIPGRRRQMGMYFQGQGYILQLRQESGLLDTEVLQSFILSEILGINEEMAKSGKYIFYPNGEEDPALIPSYVDNGSHQVGFTLFPTSVDELKEVADGGKVLPQKSTYFYPKLLTGLVLNEVAKPMDDLTVEEVSV